MEGALCAGVEEEIIVLDDDASTVVEGVALVDVKLLDVLSTELEVGAEEVELLVEDSIELDDALVDDVTDELEEGGTSTDEDDRGSASALPPSTRPCPRSMPPLTPKPSGWCEVQNVDGAPEGLSIFLHSGRGKVSCTRPTLKDPTYDAIILDDFSADELDAFFSVLYPRLAPPLLQTPLTRSNLADCCDVLGTLILSSWKSQPIATGPLSLKSLINGTAR